MEERIRNQVLADLKRKGVDTRRGPAPPKRIVENGEIAKRMQTIEDYAEKARKAMVNDDHYLASNLLYEIALLADYSMIPTPRSYLSEGTADDRSIARRGGGIE